MYRRYSVIAWTNFNFTWDGVQYMCSDGARDSITKGYAGCCTGRCCPALGYIMPHDFQCIVCTNLKATNDSVNDHKRFGIYMGTVQLNRYIKHIQFL